MRNYHKWKENELQNISNQRFYENWEYTNKWGMMLNQTIGIVTWVVFFCQWHNLCCWIFDSYSLYMNKNVCKNAGCIMAGNYVLTILIHESKQNTFFSIAFSQSFPNTSHDCKRLLRITCAKLCLNVVFY